MRLLLGLLLLAGCVHHHRWAREGSGPEALRLETYQCERDATFANKGRYGTSMDIDHKMFDRCMEAHGWVDVSDAPVDGAR